MCRGRRARGADCSSGIGASLRRDAAIRCGGRAMILKSLEIANFRKFRDPVRIAAFADGLNIVVEPNEVGKSTLLEALRAAFCIRHSAKTELVRSYGPIGDEVAPRMRVEFMAKGQSWSLEKQFIRSPFVRLS